MARSRGGAHLATGGEISHLSATLSIFHRESPVTHTGRCTDDPVADDGHGGAHRVQMSASPGQTTPCTSPIAARSATSAAYEGHIRSLRATVLSFVKISYIYRKSASRSNEDNDSTALVWCAGERAAAAGTARASSEEPSIPAPTVPAPPKRAATRPPKGIMSE